MSTSNIVITSERSNDHLSVIPSNTTERSNDHSSVLAEITSERSNDHLSVLAENTTLRICFDPKHSEFLKSKYNNSDNVLQHLTDVGFDLFLPEDIEVQPYETKFIDLGIKCEYRSDNSKTFYGYLLCPRSSISKTKLRLANSIGIIDPNYRGYLIAAVDNISNKVQKLNKGERYFQLVFTKFTKPDKVEVIEKDQLSNTKRGDGGFGSTGK